MKSVAITGASGMLGSHLSAFFLARGWRVHALVRDPDSLPIASAHLRVHRFDLSDDTHALPGDARAPMALIHCAAATRSRDVGNPQRNDEDAARRLFAAARAQEIQPIVFLSSTSARVDAPSVYGRTKYAIEGLLDPDRDLALRLGLVLSRTGGGLFQRMTSWIERTRIVPGFGARAQRVQVIHVDDVCLGIERALERNITGRLTLADPVGIRFTDLLDEIARRSGRRTLTLPVPLRPMGTLLRFGERLGIPLPVTSENLLGLEHHDFVPSSADLKRLGLELPLPREALVKALARDTGE